MDLGFMSLVKGLLSSIPRLRCLGVFMTSFKQESDLHFRMITGKITLTAVWKVDLRQSKTGGWEVTEG